MEEGIWKLADLSHRTQESLSTWVYRSEEKEKIGELVKSLYKKQLKVNQTGEGQMPCDNGYMWNL